MTEMAITLAQLRVLDAVAREAPVGGVSTEVFRVLEDKGLIVSVRESRTRTRRAITDAGQSLRRRLHAEVRRRQSETVEE